MGRPGGTVTVARRASPGANARLFAVVLLAYAAGAVLTWEIRQALAPRPRRDDVCVVVVRFS